MILFLNYALSSSTNGLVSLSVAYFLQKYMVRGLFYGFKRVTKYENFFEADTNKGKSPILVYVLWLILLPFPFQQILSPFTSGISVLGAVYYLLSVLALFALWGLSLASLVGVTKNKIFRIHSAFREALIWLMAIQWLSLVFYSSIIPSFLSSTLVTPVPLLGRIMFVFGPPALIIAYLYKRVLEKRSQWAIVEYLREKERLETVTIEVETEKVGAIKD
jgi:hypothetical protein